MCSLVYILWGNYDPWICREKEKNISSLDDSQEPFLSASSASVHRINEWWSLCGRRSSATSYLAGIKLNFSTCDSAWSSEGGQAEWRQTGCFIAKLCNTLRFNLQTFMTRVIARKVNIINLCILQRWRIIKTYSEKSMQTWDIWYDRRIKLCSRCRWHIQSFNPRRRKLDNFQPT